MGLPSHGGSRSAWKIAERLKKQGEPLRTALNGSDTDLLKGVAQPIGSYVKHPVLKPPELLSDGGGSFCACVFQMPLDLLLEAVLGASPGLVSNNLRGAQDNSQRQQ